mmetsp:Transcript_45932/g.142170  ORF Transcript_45932/g.142170 Transcript_45932/m.142170 type:complete len:222 (+) Transcript_45932:1216-1881(+)
MALPAVQVARRGQGKAADPALHIEAPRNSLQVGAPARHGAAPHAEVGIRPPARSEAEVPGPAAGAPRNDVRAFENKDALLEAPVSLSPCLASAAVCDGLAAGHREVRAKLARWRHGAAAVSGGSRSGGRGGGRCLAGHNTRRGGDRCVSRQRVGYGAVWRKDLVYRYRACDSLCCGACECCCRGLCGGRCHGARRGCCRCAHDRCVRGAGGCQRCCRRHVC